MIDVIIPVYKAHNTINRTLKSISCQTMIDKCKIYIVNDCDGIDYSDIINKYQNINITYLIMNENKGPGLARQFGMDNSTSKYIIFIDADDYFYDERAISLLYNCIENTDSDIVISNFRYEREHIIQIKRKNAAWLHGKIYRRKLINDKNIRFNATRANEDNGFNNLCFLCSTKVKFLDEITYVYSESNPDSITRCNNYEYKFSGLEYYAYNLLWAMKEAYKRNCNLEKICLLDVNILMSMYYYYLNFKNRDDVHKLVIWSIQLLDFLLLYKDEQYIYDNEYRYIEQYRMLNLGVEEIISFKQYIQLIKKEKNINLYND